MNDLISNLINEIELTGNIEKDIGKKNLLLTISKID